MRITFTQGAAVGANPDAIAPGELALPSLGWSV
jgi:hypothetical protein